MATAETMFHQSLKSSDSSVIYQLIYHSYASGEFGMDDLLKMLVDARIANESRMVTGMLIYHDGQFLQLLEGDEHVLKILSSRIYEDPRHHTAVQLSFHPIKSRDFSSWSMGFANLDENTQKSIRGLYNYGEGNFEWESHVYNAAAAKALILRLRNLALMTR